MTVNWGDGTSDTYNSVGDKLHTYASKSIYTVQISGTMTSLNYGDGGSTEKNKPKLIKCLSFGNIGLTNIDTAFKNCNNLNQVPSSLPVSATGVRDLLFGCKLFNGSEVSSWNISNLTSLKGMFNQATGFNIDIGSWNTSQITDMSSMFAGATSFNRDISSWSLAGLNSSSSLNSFMSNVTLSNSNYDNILINWNNNKNSYRNDLSVNFGFSKYTSSASGARSALISYGWVITDGGLQA